MGSRTKYYTDLQVNNMFEGQDNLWGHELARVAAANSTMNPAAIMPSIINDANMFYNEAVFDKMGVTANVDMSVARLTKEGIGLYINQNIDPDIDHVVEWFYKDDNQVVVEPLILQVYTALEDEYTHTGDYTNTLWQELNGDMYEIEFLPYDIDDDDTPYTIRKAIHTGKEIPDVEVVNDIYGVWMSPVVDGEPDHEHAKHVMIPTDARSVAAVKYEDMHDDMHCIFIFDSEVTASAEAYKALVIPFYKNFNAVPDTRELDFIYGRFGLAGKDEDGDSLKESMASSADMNTPLYHTPWIEMMISLVIG